ncbi:nuclear transport factor 2 family protein [Pedobacter sp. AW31-3R]|uniref:nuclear transport factor 2 family protein n=1 Tax=Pedobacter sp. AW31-3R TaxID=3445781 RepID=UPI003FA0CC52
MKNTKEIIIELIEAFDKNDVPLILTYFTEDIEWNMVGDQTFSGKESIRKFFEVHPDMQMIASTKSHILIDGDHAAVDGEVQCIDKGTGIHHDMYYCDLYDLENGRVKKMTSYVVNKKKA